ncbi:MAG: ROK family protein [Planctomycetia bacterium]|nr:ROK family protein [Planctomycetia bacterium]
MNRIGIDLGGTKIEGILLDKTGNILERKRIPTNRQNGYEYIIDKIANLISDLQVISKIETIVGICTPGTIAPHTGKIKNSNTVCLIGKPFKEDIESEIGCKINMDNDANCFAIAETKLGAAKNYNIVFGVIIGTGVGGGIVINGKVHHGRMSIAGEWGHHTLYPDGNLCYCGRRGCVETYISGPSLEKRWKELTGETQSLPYIIAGAEQLPKYKEKLYLKWKQELLRNFGIALANVIDILDPDIVVLGGGVSNIPFLYNEGIKSVYQNVFSDDVDTPILKNKLGDSAGVFGAAYL